MLQTDAPIPASGEPAALRDLAAYYRDLYDLAPDMCLSVDAQTGTVVDCNATAAKITGYTKAELVGRPVLDLYHPACRAQAQQAFQTFVSAGEVHDVELQILCRDGSILDVSLSATAVRDAAGKVVRSRSVWRDITARKRAIAEQRRLDAQTRASEARFATIFHSSPVALHLTRIATGEIIDVNPAAANLIGYRREDLIGRRWLDLDPLADGQPLLTAAQLELGKSVPVTIYSRSGLSRSCLATADAITIDGEPCLLVSTVDITERKRAEAALQAGERRLQLAARAAGLGIWHWNFADNSLEWDERMCELYAVPEEERTGPRPYDAWRSRLHPDDLERAEAMMSGMLTVGSEWDRTFRIVLPDGSIRHIHASSVVEADEQGRPLRMVGVNRDVTQQKVYERSLEETNVELERQVAARTAELRATVAELQLANAGKDAFMASISHELRTPLMGVLGMAELLASNVRGSLNGDQAKYVAAIDESGRRLLETLNNVLLYTQLMAGVPIICEPCLLSDLCAAAVQAVRPKAERMSQSIRQTVDPPNLEMESDVGGIYNMIRMLLDNAIKFTPEGGCIEVAITAEPPSAAGPSRSVRIVVSDNGIGMTPAEIAVLFRPFAQLDNTLARRREGLGIGLAYVYKMAELLGGSVAVAGNPEGGSRFTVTLPG